MGGGGGGGVGSRLDDFPRFPRPARASGLQPSARLRLP